MSASVLPLLFWTAFALTGLAVAVAAWAALDSMRYVSERGAHEFWKTGWPRYRRLGIVFIVLCIAALLAGISISVIQSHDRF
jgi:hypothetical protein